jgi:hypothetical protein
MHAARRFEFPPSLALAVLVSCRPVAPPPRQQVAPSAAPASKNPPSAAPAAKNPSEVVAAYAHALDKAGTAGSCDDEKRRVRSALIEDPRLSDADLERERDDRDYRGKGPMPYPSPGTACAIFGIVSALEDAINERRRTRGLAPMSWQ